MRRKSILLVPLLLALAAPPMEQHLAGLRKPRAAGSQPAVRGPERYFLRPDSASFSRARNAL